VAEAEESEMIGGNGTLLGLFDVDGAVAWLQPARLRLKTANETK
jgi:hypothetical protein